MTWTGKKKKNLNNPLTIRKKISYTHWRGMATEKKKGIYKVNMHCCVNKLLLLSLTKNNILNLINHWFSSILKTKPVNPENKKKETKEWFHVGTKTQILSLSFSRVEQQKQLRN